MRLRKRSRKEMGCSNKGPKVSSVGFPVILALALALINDRALAFPLLPKETPLISLNAHRISHSFLLARAGGDITKNDEEEQRESSTTQSRCSLVLADSNTIRPEPLSLPPWLERYQNCRPEQVKKEIEWLEQALQKQGFKPMDVSDIVKAIYLAGRGEVPMIVGCITFCKLLLRLEEDTTTVVDGPIQSNYLATKDVLLASILHYTECFTARRDGIYNQVEVSALGGAGLATDTHEFSISDAAAVANAAQICEADYAIESTKVFTASQMSLRSRLSGSASATNDALSIFTSESLRLAESAAQIKRAEILTHAFLNQGKPWNRKAYADMRNLLVTLGEDWRALAIRCVASLYRLEGVADVVPLGYDRRPEATLHAKDSLRVYASLAQQLGLHRLKSQLEAVSFRILYPRQYTAASTLFHEHGAAMKAISSFLSLQLKRLLTEDSSLMYELENLKVIARVKEPYSFWRKLLKTRWTTTSKGSDDTGGSSSAVVSRKPNDISLMDVNDGVALRVILKARKFSPDEPEETTRSRERMLCYYVQRVVLTQWPAVDTSRIKDYIRFPKANGYQSLHHTSKISRNGRDFFFEIQIRSEEMHRLAEFGVAAHWTYKLDGKNALLQSKPIRNNSMQSQAPAKSSAKSAGLVLYQKKASENSGSHDNFGLITTTESASYIHALERSRRELLQSHVYVFLADSMSLGSGQLLTLTAGSHVTDVLERLQQEQELGFVEGEVKIWKNGKLAFLEETVRNGDMILIEPVSESFRTRTKVPRSQAVVP